jgi:xanthine dehydrogenase accessory factor
MLATVIFTSGSTPVPAGARMVIHPIGSFGSVGGGALEARVEETARRWLRDGHVSGIRRFELTEDDPESPMLCGGLADVLIEQLTPAYKECYETTQVRRNAGQDMAILTSLDHTGLVRAKIAIDPGSPPDVLAISLSLSLPAPDLGDVVRNAVGGETVIRTPFAEGELVIEPFLGVQDLFIFGGGHVSTYVARSAAMAGFRVVVVDDRADFADPRRFPDAAATLAVPFDEAWDRITVRSSSSVVIVTRGHKHDQRVLERAVQTPARYIGMIGSRNKVTATFARLVERGTPKTMLEKVRAPIGLKIGAITAEEIGISITAELIAVRRGITTETIPLSARHRGG